MEAAAPRKEPADLLFLRVLERRSDGPEQQPQPEAEAHGQNHLPEASQFEKFPALVTEPHPQGTEQLVDAQDFAQQAAHHQHDQGPEEQVDAHGVAARFGLTEGGGQQQAAGHIAGGDPEQGQLQVPGAQDVAGQVLGQVDAVEIAGIGPVVRQGAADHDLDQEEQRDDRRST